MNKYLGRVIFFREGEFRFLNSGVKHDLRWASWSPKSNTALLVGNRGIMVVYDGYKFKRLELGFKDNIRCVSHRPFIDEALLVGNNGFVSVYSDGKSRKLTVGVDVNLRRCKWNRSGEVALIVGNQGACFRMENERFKMIGGASANLRDVAWNPGKDFALVVGNGYGGGLGGLIPSKNVFLYEQDSGVLEPIFDRPGTDFTGVDWRPNGESALLVGYDTIWLTPVIYSYREEGFEEVSIVGKNIAPTCVAWRSLGDYALVGTALPNEEHTVGEVLRVDDSGVSTVFSHSRYFTTCIAWRRRSDEALIIGSPRAKSFHA